MNSDVREALGPVAEIHVSRIAEQRDAIPQIVDGSMRGIIVRNVLDANAVARLVHRLQQDDSALPAFRPPVFKGHVLGRPLVSASDGLESYLDHAAQFRAGAAAVDDAYPQMEESIHQALTGLAADCAVSVPRGADGRPYLAATIRVLIEGDRLPLHYENETLRNPVMTALRPLLDLSTLMSFYLPLVIPPGGGQLRLFSTHCLDGGDSLIERLGGDDRALPYFEERGFAVILPEVGDLLVFDGGRWYHDVTPIIGGMRWTLGGFLAMTRDHRTVHYWS